MCTKVTGNRAMDVCMLPHLLALAADVMHVEGDIVLRLLSLLI